MPPLPHHGLRQAADLPRFKAWVASDQGLRRRRLEDAWHVGTVPWQGGLADVAFVFDGLGGHPFGQEAAWAAADAVPVAASAAGERPSFGDTITWNTLARRRLPWNAVTSCATWVS